MDHSILVQGSPRACAGQSDGSSHLPGDTAYTDEASVPHPVMPQIYVGCLYYLCLIRELKRPKETNYRDS